MDTDDPSNYAQPLDSNYAVSKRSTGLCQVAACLTPFLKNQVEFPRPELRQGVYLDIELTQVLVRHIHNRLIHKRVEMDILRRH